MIAILSVMKTDTLLQGLDGCKNVAFLKKLMLC